MDFIKKAADKAFEKLHNKDGLQQTTDSGYTYPGPQDFGSGAAREATPAYPGVYNMNEGRYDQSSGSSDPGYPGFFTTTGSGYNQSAGSSNPGYPGFFTTGSGYNQSSGYSGYGNYSGYDPNSVQQTSGVGGNANSYGAQGYDQTTSGYGGGSTVSGYGDKNAFDRNSAQQTPAFGGGYPGYGDQGYGQDTSCFRGSSADSGYGYKNGIPYSQQSIGASAQRSAGIGGAGYYNNAAIASAMRNAKDLGSSMQSMGASANDLAG